jgi:hypothetical protein
MVWLTGDLARSGFIPSAGSSSGREKAVNALLLLYLFLP